MRLEFDRMQEQVPDRPLIDITYLAKTSGWDPDGQLVEYSQAGRKQRKKKDLPPWQLELHEDQGEEKKVHFQNWKHQPERPWEERFPHISREYRGPKNHQDKQYRPEKFEAQWDAKPR